MKNLNQFPSDLAVCFLADGIHLVAASISSEGKIITEQFAVGESFFPALKEWRLSIGHQTDLNTIFRFVPQYFTEQTNVASLSQEVCALSDSELTLWLIDAASRDIVGENGQPIFESPLSKSLYDYARLPNGNISLTELPRERQHEALKQVIQSQPLDGGDLASLTRYVSDEAQPLFLHATETRLRAITRYLAHQETKTFGTLASDESVAVFAFTAEGCGYALWNPNQGFNSEFGEWFNLNFDENEIPEGIERSDYIGRLYLDSVINFLHEQFYKRTVSENDLETSVSINRIYWVANGGLNTPIAEVLDDFSEEYGFSFSSVEGTEMEKMIAEGLLLAFDEEIEQLVPSINLANDISVQNESINAEVLNQKAIGDRNKRQVAIACMMLPIILAFGLVVGLILNNLRVSASLAWRENTGTTEQNRLRPILQARADYEKTLRWYEDILKQIVALRQKQTSALSFAAKLDPLYPQTTAFFISDMKLQPGGGFELKGFTRDEMEVSAFVSSLEFAQDEKGGRYFSGLQLEFKQGTNSGAIPISTSSSGGNVLAGVSTFFLKGNFSPASILKPQTPTGVAPATPPPAINSAVQTPSTNTTSSAANTAANVQGGTK